jgi:hypothetical protein
MGCRLLADRRASPVANQAKLSNSGILPLFQARPAIIVTFVQAIFIWVNVG